MAGDAVTTINVRRCVLYSGRAAARKKVATNKRYLVQYLYHTTNKWYLVEVHLRRITDSRPTMQQAIFFTPPHLNLHH